jgi:hypothetical protein
MLREHTSQVQFYLSLMSPHGVTPNANQNFVNPFRCFVAALGKYPANFLKNYLILSAVK